MDDAKTVWCGNLADEVTEELLYELFLQVAPLQRVKIPTDREGRKSNFGFVTFKHEISVPYAVQLLNGTRMFDKNLNIKPRNGGTQQDKQKNHNQNDIQRSFSYPNDEYHQNRQNQHTRFNEIGDMGPQHVSYDNLMQMGDPRGDLMNVNYNYQENYDHRFGNNYGHNVESNRQQWERNSYRNKDRDRGRKDNDRFRDDYERDDRRNHSNNTKNSGRRNNDRNNHHFDRSGGRRNHRHF